MNEEQLWTAGGWSSKFALDLPDDSTGYAHTPEDVSKVSGSDIERYLDYIDAVCDRSMGYIRDLSDAGQAAILRGILERRAIPTHN